MTKPEKDKEQKMRPSDEKKDGKTERTRASGEGENKGTTKQEKGEKILNQDEKITNQPDDKNISF